MTKFLGMKLDKLLAWAVIIVGVVWVANYMGFFATTGGIGTTTPTGEPCLFADTVTLSVSADRSLLDTTGAATGITALPVSIYTNADATTPFAQILTVAGVANTTVAVPCHTQYKYAIDNSALFYNASYPASGFLGAEHAAESTKLKADLVGAIATTLDNSTTLGSASFTVAGGGSATIMGNSATSIPMTLHIRQTTAQGIFKAPLIIGFSYNSTAFVSARAIGWQSIVCPSWAPAITMAATNRNDPYRMCYTYNTDMKDVTELLVPIELVSSATGPVIENVTMRIDDTGGAFKNGVLVTGYVNPDSGADWGATGVAHIIHIE